MRTAGELMSSVEERRNEDRFLGGIELSGWHVISTDLSRAFAYTEYIH